MYSDFTSTPIYNLCAIRFPAVDLYPQKEIRLRLTGYKTPSRSPTLAVQQFGSLYAASVLKPYALDPHNAVTGGFAVSRGPSSLPKLTLDGWIHTSTANDGSGNQLPQTTVKSNDGNVYNLTDAELIPMYIEGRMNVNPNDRQAIHPLWFRDPYGKVFTSPRIVDYSGSFVEAVPGRCNFTMVLML